MPPAARKSIPLSNIVRFTCPNEMGFCREDRPLSRESLGFALDRSPRVEPGRRPVSRHFRHRADGLPDGRLLLSAGRGRRHLSGRIRQGRLAGAAGADRREQSGRHPVDRLRHLRPGIFHLSDRRQLGPLAVSRAHRRRRAGLRPGLHPLGQPDARTADDSRGDRFDRRSPAGDSARHPRRFLRLGRDEVANALCAC